MMTVYISMLRGINVGGQKKVMMPELKALYENLGFTKVSTYIQSGNVIFNTDQSILVQELSSLIENAIIEKYGFYVPVIIRNIDEMQAIIMANPYVKEPEQVTEKLYITFLEKEPSKDLIDKINPFDFLPDKFKLSNREIYLNCASGYGTTKLSNTFFENKLNVKATTRNWNTVNKLLEIATND